MKTSRRITPLFLTSALCVLAAAQPCAGQSLRGSRESVSRMYEHAQTEDLTFYETARDVRKALANGRLQSLASDPEIALHKVGYPFVRPATRTFVKRLAVQYRAECGEQLEVTSGVRPATRQPANSVAISVHPTGMAVDLHKPKDAKCLRWLRSTLIDLENAGVLEATEEFAPPHFHVAVYETPYRRYLAASTSTGERRQLASSQAADASSYRVRPGDTLWAIARAHDTTVDALVSANHLGDRLIRPGQELVIPPGG